MNIEEAKKEYGILIPSDKEFYSEEYIEYFKNNEKNGVFEKYREFQEMFNKCFLTTFFYSNTDDLSVADRKAVVLGGQTGAGKSALVHQAKKEALEQGRAMFLIDDDMYRILYPRALEILKECPEHYTAITAIGSGPVTPKIMKYASNNGLNFIFDGTMKNSRIIDTAMSWDNYDVNWKIMATSKIESLISMFERNEALRRNKSGRLITVDAHNETYIGIGPTLMQLESLDDIGRIQIYSRGNNHLNPILQYDSNEPGVYSSAYQALQETRRKDEERSKQSGIRERIERIKNTDIPLNLAELKAIEELERNVLMEIREL